MDASDDFRMAVLTRPRGRNAELAQALFGMGWHVTDCPALEIDSIALSSDQVLPQPAQFDLVIFVSVPAVEAYRDQLLARNIKFSWPRHTAIGCVGPASALAIRQAFGDVPRLFQPEPDLTQDSESLWAVLHSSMKSIKRVLIVRGQDGRDWLAARFAENGIAVDFHMAYCRNAATWSENNLKTFQAWERSARHPVWLLTSTHAIQSTLAQFEAHGLINWARSCGFILTHPRQKAYLIEGFAGCSEEQAPRILISNSNQEEILSNFEHFRDNQTTSDMKRQ